MGRLPLHAAGEERSPIVPEPSFSRSRIRPRLTARVVLLLTIGVAGVAAAILLKGMLTDSAYASAPGPPPGQISKPALRTAQPGPPPTGKRGTPAAKSTVPHPLSGPTLPLALPAAEPAAGPTARPTAAGTVRGEPPRAGAQRADAQRA